MEKNYSRHKCIAVGSKETSSLHDRPTYPPTENDQYKHLSNVSKMIVLIILGSTHQMSILNDLAHQFYTLMADVVIH